MPTRRVIAGKSNGASIIVSDEDVELTTAALLPGAGIELVWGADAIPSVPNDGESDRTDNGYFPSAGGARLIVFRTFGKEPETPPVADDASVRDFREKFPGMMELISPDEPGMHASETVDLSIVVEGAVDFELEGGETVRLSSGDVLINHGTRHAWHQIDGIPATIIAVLLGAEPSGS